MFHGMINYLLENLETTAYVSTIILGIISLLKHIEIKNIA
jgi:hypothetical protein